jgi:hypothetical protein
LLDALASRDQARLADPVVDVAIAVIVDAVANLGGDRDRVYDALNSLSILAANANSQAAAHERARLAEPEVLVDLAVAVVVDLVAELGCR